MEEVYNKKSVNALSIFLILKPSKTTLVHCITRLNNVLSFPYWAFKYTCIDKHNIYLIPLISYAKFCNGMIFLGFSILRHIGQKLLVCNHSCMQRQQNKCPQNVREGFCLGSKQSEHLPQFNEIGSLVCFSVLLCTFWFLNRAISISTLKWTAVSVLRILNTCNGRLGWNHGTA